MMKYLSLKRMFNNEKALIPITVGLLLFLIERSNENNFIDILNSVFLRCFNEASIMNVMKWFLHKAPLIYIIISLASHEKNVYLRYELIRLRNKNEIIFKKIIMLIIYVVYYYMLIFFTIYIFSIIDSNTGMDNVANFRNIIYLIFKLIMVNTVYCILSLTLVIVYDSKISFITIIFLDCLYIINDNNLLYNKLYETDNLIYMKSRGFFELLVIALILSITLTYFMKRYTDKVSLSE